MPTYEYKCPSGHRFEKFFPTMNDQRRLKCPTCGRLAERQISGGAGLVFKGSGFYITDYKRAGEPPGKRDGESQSTEAKPAEGKPGDAKPADANPAAAQRSDGAKKKKDSGDK
jgi:putative FmdB family regulatory protein